jgi:drug/metabolite transporter (DMT)-like permease
LIAIGLACLSAILFGGMSVGLRAGLSRHSDADLATLCTVAAALVVGLVFAAVEAPSRGVHAGAAWPFVLAGLISPGAAQILVTLAIREAGASRSSVVLGAAPLVSVTIALVFLGEPASAALIIGAVLVVAGGLELAWERGRPDHVRRIGLLFAFLATILFSARDNLVRWLSRDTPVPPGVAAAAALLGGAVLLAFLLVPRLRTRPTLAQALPFLGVGVLFGLSYVSLFEAYYRGRVTVVSPLVATESLWGVFFSIVFIRHVELVGKRLVLGALLVVAGGVLIGVFR